MVPDALTASCDFGKKPEASWRRLLQKSELKSSLDESASLIYTENMAIPSSIRPSLFGSD